MTTTTDSANLLGLAAMESEYDWLSENAYSTAEFFSLVDTLVERYFYGFYHSLGRKIIGGELSKRDLQVLATQEFAYYACTTWWNAGKIQNAHTLEQQRLLHGPLLDELGEDLMPGGTLPAHSELFLRYCEGIGLTRKQVKEAPLAPAVMLAVTDLKRISETRPVFEFLAVSNLVVEKMRPHHYSEFLQAFKKHYTWVPQEALVFYEIHAGLDKDHESIGRRIVAQYAQNKRDQDAIFASVLRSLALRLAMYDGIEKMIATPGAVGMVRWPNFPSEPWPRPIAALAESE